MASASATLEVPGAGQRVRKVLGGLQPHVPMIPAGVVLVGWLAWAQVQGGYFPRTWYPSALAAVGLLVVAAVGGRRALPANRWSRIALGALAGLVAWSFLSIIWADAAGDAWEASNQSLLLLAVAWIVSLLPWTPRSTAVLLGAFALGAGLVCLLSLRGAAGSEPLGDFFLEGRYIDPIGYSNGVSALPAMAFWGALVVAYRRSTHIVLRPLFLALAVFLLEFSLMPQSRGSLIGLIVALPLFVALAPDRLRLIGPLLVCVAAAVLSIEPVYDVYTVGVEVHSGESDQALRPVVEDAASAIYLVTLGALVAGVLLAVLDARVRPSPAVVRGTRLGVGGLVAVVGVVALAAALMNAGRISDELDDRWETFNSSEERVEPTGARVAASFPDQRSDYWNVALDLFREQPVAGVGAGSYGVRYNAERKYSKPSRYTHDIWLRTLAEGGIVAFGLLLAYLAAAFGGILAARRGASSAGKAVGAACFAAGAYFFVHASFDWLEEFPALASPAFALPLIGIAAIAGAASPGGAAGRSALVGWALGGIAAALALVSLLVPYLSLRYFERGVDTGTANARSAFDDLDRAAELNPLDPEPHLRAGTIAIAVGDEARARREFEKGLDVQANSYSHLELGLLDAQIGRFRSAERHLARAGALDRNDRVVAAARVRVSRRERVDPGAFNRGIRSITRERFTRPVK